MATELLPATDIAMARRGTGPDFDANGDGLITEVEFRAPRARR